MSKKSTQEKVLEYKARYSGMKLLEKHSIDEEGIWEIHGEDINCDYGGHHYEPFLGLFEGRLEDVLETAVELEGFWTWGGGGRIIKRVPRKVTKSTKREQQELRERIEAMEQELAALKEKLL